MQAGRHVGQQAAGADKPRRPTSAQRWHTARTCIVKTLDKLPWYTGGWVRWGGGVRWHDARRATCGELAASHLAWQADQHPVVAIPLKAPLLGTVFHDALGRVARRRLGVSGSAARCECGVHVWQRHGTAAGRMRAAGCTHAPYSSRSHAALVAHCTPSCDCGVTTAPLPAATDPSAHRTSQRVRAAARGIGSVVAGGTRQRRQGQ